MKQVDLVEEAMRSMPARNAKVLQLENLTRNSLPAFLPDSNDSPQNLARTEPVEGEEGRGGEGGISKRRREEEGVEWIFADSDPR